jgi:hypothetical protein
MIRPQASRCKPYARALAMAETRDRDSGDMFTWDGLEG